MASDEPPILRPTPRRAFDMTSPMLSSTPPTPSADSQYSHTDGPSTEPSRTRSILNLTSSTLFGIYSPTTYGDRDEPSTPWGTGALTPSRRTSTDSPRPGLEPGPGSRGSARSPRRPSAPLHLGFFNFVLPLLLRTILLFAFGIAYGLVITHLHDHGQFVPVQVEGIDRYDWRYSIFWGIAGVGLGSLLPWVDLLWEDQLGSRSTMMAKGPQETDPISSRVEEDGPRPDATSGSGSGLGADWNPVVRSVGAFIGIAFAIRKLPWQSTLQVSLTLALANPVLWYLIDRSKTGLLLSAAVGITGTAVLLRINPAMVPPPAPVAASPFAPATASPFPSSSSVHSSSGASLNGIHPWLSTESIGVGTWIASVLFCSCVCFGNIGRRLALPRISPSPPHALPRSQTPPPSSPLSPLTPSPPSWPSPSPSGLSVPKITTTMSRS